MQKENQNQNELPSVGIPFSTVPVKIFYGKGKAVMIKDKSFKQAMIRIWQSDEFKDYEPMKMVFTSTGKVLFMDKQAFHSYLNGGITMQELIELTECDELYRNTKDFISEGDCVIDAGSLWKSNRKELTLIDDDNIFTTKIDLTMFEIVE
jgi:lysyl-tRNA synthetase class II